MDVFAGLNRSLLTLAVAGAFVVLLPAWLLLLWRRSERATFALPRLLLGTALLAALLLLPFLGVGLSLLLPAAPSTAARLAAPAGQSAPAAAPTAKPEKSAAEPARPAAPAPAAVAPPATADSAAQKEQAALGKTILERERCLSCHSINGRGGSIGPELADIAKRRNAAWIMQHFEDPQAVSPGTLMPKYNLPKDDFQALTAYLLTLKRE